MTGQNRYAKRLGRVCMIVLALVMLFAMVIPAAHAAQIKNVSTDAYEFPVKGGTEEWKAFATHTEMLEACQIPIDALQKMSTSGLMETTLSYPLLGDMKAFNNLQDGFDSVARGFNGLPELLNRKDAGSKLLERYQNMDPLRVEESWTLLEKGQYSADFLFIEVLLAQSAILDNMTDLQQKDLLTEALEKSEAKQQRGKVFGQNGQTYTALLMARILQKLGCMPFESQIEQGSLLMGFLAGGSVANAETISDILEYARLYLYDVQPRGYSTRAAYGTVDTPRQPNPTHIGVLVDWMSLPDQGEGSVAWWDWWVATYYPNATKLRQANAKYNCHSYAWFSTSAYNNCWMNRTEYAWNGYGVEYYWWDGSYVYDNYPNLGDKIHWAYGDHSGIVTGSFGTQNFCTSKWGAGPLMRHEAYYCPYYAGPYGFGIGWLKLAQ